MAMSQKFGFKMGQGQSEGGGGMGMGGMMSNGATDGPPKSLLGGESMLGQGKKESTATSQANAQGAPSPGAGLSGKDGVGAPPGGSAESRPTTSIGGEAVLSEYDKLVEAYFRRLTTKKPPPTTK